MLFLIRVGEISLKGGNRGYFEKKLIQNIKWRLKSAHPKVTVSRGRFVLEVGDSARNLVVNALSTTFGIVGFAKSEVTEKKMEAIRRSAFDEVERFLVDRESGTFKIAARRSDKSFPLTSYEIAKELGADIRARFPGMTVDVHEPELLLSVEIRERAFIYGNEVKGPGGLPVGVAGKGIVLLSGGIDSPVSAYLMAKRGLAIDAAYFHTYPYTSDEALEKVKTLAGKLSGPCCGINLFVVPFTNVALEIRKNGPPAQTTLLMRAAMMEAASRIAARRNTLCLVTGESLGQVASQTVQSMHFTGSASPLPVFRPLIGLDKDEIVATAKRIDTFDTSILPFEDCCTVFSPNKPLIRPDLEMMRKSYTELHMEGLIGESIDNMEKFWFPPVMQEPR